VRVDVCVADRDPVSFDIPGEPLVAKISPFVANWEGDSLRLEYVPSDGIDKLCGFLVIPYLSHRGTVSVERIWIPPPPPFSQEDVVTMWREIEESGLGVPSGLPLQGEMESSAQLNRRRLGDRRRDEFLQDVRSSALQLLMQWPTRQSPNYFWRRVGLAGGVEDVVTTSRQGWLAGVGERHPKSNRDLPERSARRSAEMTPWSSMTIVMLMTRICTVLRTEYEQTNSVRTITDLLVKVARTAQPLNQSAVDPPPSSWPRPMLALAENAWRFLELGTSAGECDPRPVPLCEVWRLYERWMSVYAVEVVTRKIGAPDKVHNRSLGGERWYALWKTDEWEVAIESQYSFTDQVGTGLGWRRGFRSATSRLIPDVILILRRPGEDPRLLIIDAKERSTGFGQDEAAAAAAKYLWGIRRHDLSRDESIEVVLATSREVESAFFPRQASMMFLQTTPSRRADLEHKIVAFIGAS
jgi:hypothetical protein